MIPFRLGKDYTLRFDALVTRLGLKRPLLVRNLLSLDPILIDDIEAKAKSLGQMTIDESAMRNDKKQEKMPDVVTIRLDEEQERRFNALVVSLGVGTKVQVLRNLLSGDPRTVATVCTKAKSISLDPAPLEEVVSTHTSTPEVHGKTKVIEQTAAIEELIRKKVSEFEKELRSILEEQMAISYRDGKMPVQVEQSTEPPNVSEGSSASLQHTEPQVANLFPRLEAENEQATSKPRPGRGRPRKVPSGVDHSEVRQQIMEYFRVKSGKDLGSDPEAAKASKVAIDKMLDKGKPVSEFMQIIDNMCYYWIEAHPNMFLALTPKTIFDPDKWKNNLDSMPLVPKGLEGSKEPVETSSKYDKFYITS